MPFREDGHRHAEDVFPRELVGHPGHVRQSPA
jgi:hypothetical protein